ncbi:MAG: peptidase C11 [Lachnospiraceae bacterium]|nr:peptidase C11 [Lachnospiraceae bacterium]
MANRPIGREKRVGGSGGGIRRGGAVGTGPVGGSSRIGGMGSAGGSTGPNRSRGGGGGLIRLIIIIGILLLGGGGGLGSFILGSSGSNADYYDNTQGGNGASQQSGPGLSQAGLVEALLGGSQTGYSGGEAAEWTLSDNTGKLDKNTPSGLRERYTDIIGDGSDVTTIMVYMCGTDLESKNGMATRDLQEMAAATLSDNVRVVVYTGGCRAWKNNIVSSSKNQIYEVRDGGLICREKDMGASAMTDPDNLASFIEYCKSNYPANRYDLIFWDHGGGSKSGYGYDEKNPSAGSMSLAGIDEALKKGGVKFDFIGFDACLMATVETGLVASRYGDYLIASEETEPGVGWYYTSWLTDYSKDPSMSTLDLGQRIIDSFTDACRQSCSGQKTTLSLIDLAELSTVTDELSAFMKANTELIKGNNYKQVANARAASREFAASSRIDQVDLVHLASKVGTDEGKRLSEALLSAVKYNRVSRGMTNAYGISAYFPGTARSNVSAKSVAGLYQSIGMDEEYLRCISACATMQGAGQYVSNGGASSYSSDGTLSGGTINGSDILGMFGALSGAAGSNSSSYGSADMIGSMLSSFMGDGLSNVTGRSVSELNEEEVAAYIYDNHFDEDALLWMQGEDGAYIAISNEQWEYVTDLELNMVYDDGQGYLNLGLDNIIEIDDEGRLYAPEDRTWLALDGNIVSYYHISTTGTEDDYEITGRVPVLLNGDYANLILVFTSEEPYGYVAGVTYDYREGETETVAKNITELTQGDELVFICDGFDYNGNYEATYSLGDPYIVKGDMSGIEITNEAVGDGRVLMMYRFIDIYGAEHYTPVIGD